MAIKMMRKLSLGSFGISVLLHVTLFFMVSGWVLIQAVSPKIVPVASNDPYASEQTVEVPPDIPEDDVMPVSPSNDPVETTDTTVAQTGMPTDVITAAGPSSFNLPPSVGIYVPGAAVNTAAPPATGESKTTDAMKKIAVGQIFGTKVEANKLGLIIDVSGSALPYLAEVFNDVEKSFNDAVIVMVGGAGFQPIPRNQVKLNKYVKGQLTERMIERTAVARKRNPNYAIFFDKLLGRRDVYYVETQRKNNEIEVVQYAFEELFKHGVDTIYWFSDFADPMDGALTKSTLETVLAKNIRVYVNNFSGNGSNIGMRFARQVVQETGGSATVKKR